MKHLVLVCALALPCAAAAQTVGNLKAMASAFANWTTGNTISNGQVTAMVNLATGQQTLTSYVGTSTDAPITLASLSKAITASCVATLVNGGTLSTSDTLGDLYPNDTTKIGALLNDTTKVITVAELLTHSSGLKPDSTQQTMSGWLNSTSPKNLAAAENALGRSMQEGTPGTYFYNNENYAILGTIIAHVTGESYYDHCTSKVITPLSLSTAAPSPKFGAFAAWGGWQMSSVDYMTFVSSNFSAGGTVGNTPTSWPSVAVGGGAYYGMGTSWRASGNSYNFWHFGSLCFPTLPGYNFGSYFAYWTQSRAAMAEWNACTDGTQDSQLDSAMSSAAFQN